MPYTKQMARRLARFIPALVGVLLGLAIASGSFGWGSNSIASRISGGLAKLLPFDDPYFLPLFCTAAFLVIALHELGHVVAAKAQGFRILTYAVSPFALQCRGETWRLRWSPSLRVGGFVAVDPVTTHHVRRRTMIMVAGGPLGSLMTALIGAAAGFIAGPRLPVWLTDELKTVGFLSTIIFVIGLIPLPSKLVVNDAARILMLRKPGPRADRFCTLLALIGASRSGIRPRDFNPELVAALPGPADASPDWIGASLIRYNVLIDTNRIEEAREALLAVLNADIHPQLREMLALQAAWFEAKFRHDLDAARKWMPAKLSKRSDPPYRNTLLRAQAGIAFLEGRLDDAGKLARESLEVGKRIDDIAAATQIRERTEELLSEIDAARASARLDSAELTNPARNRH